MTRTKPWFLNDLQKSQALREWKAFDDALRSSTILCEGLKDKRALAACGYSDVITASGRTYQVGPLLVTRKVGHVIILTDMDARGNELAFELKQELERFSITCDVELRIRISRLLRLRYFEDMRHMLDEFYVQTQR